MKRKFLFIALALALPLALIVPLRAARSWQPRVLELPTNVFADTTGFYWRTNGLTLAKYHGNASPLALDRWNGERVSLRALPAQSVSLDREGSIAARLYSPDGRAAHVELWDVARGQVLQHETAQLHAHDADKNRLGYAACAAIAPDGTRVAWDALKPYGVLVADTRTGREVARWMVPTRDANGPIEAREILGLAWSPDQSQLAVAGKIYVAIVDAASGKLRHLWRQPDTSDNPISWSPDGKTIAIAWGRGPVIYVDGYTGGPRTKVFLRVHDAQSGAIVHQWSAQVASDEQAQGVTNLDFSPDSTQLAWGTHDGQALVMNLSSGAIEQRFGLQISPNAPPGFGPMRQGASPSAQYVAYSPDGQSLALASMFRVVLRRVK